MHIAVLKVTYIKTVSKVIFILGGVNKYLMSLAKEQIRLAFEQSEKEVQDLHQRTKEGIETARLNGKQQKKNYAPTSAEIADLLGVSEEEVRAIESYRHGVSSLDSPLSVDNSLTLSDTLQADYSLEDEAIDKYMRNMLKVNYGALWSVSQPKERTL